MSNRLFMYDRGFAWNSVCHYLAGLAYACHCTTNICNSSWIVLFLKMKVYDILE